MALIIAEKVKVYIRFLWLWNPAIRLPIAAPVSQQGASQRIPMAVTLQSHVDEHSYQVYTDADERFWFRLERERDRDIATDYFIGSFPAEQSGYLLFECYRVLGLLPRKTMIFRDILAGKEPTDRRAVRTREDLYAASGKTLFSQYGMKVINRRTEESRGKYNLILTGFDL